MIELSDFVDLNIKKNQINSDPMILLNGKPYKRLSQLNDSDDKLKKRPYSSYNYIYKDSKYFSNHLGKEAKEGVIIIDTIISIYCKRYPKIVYLINDKEVDSDQYLKKLKNLTESKNEIMTYWNEIRNIPSKNNERMSISIINTKLRTNSK
ncbi:hypothetical protein [Lacinutrix sp. Bg11-31]|uniref:hypothetical protein n=1 Tax=Lacinutrix sp. Bg11-31 TaxID=2057808 RepID=UPI0012FDB4B7|nr:hypothetical protein [Lacinutrix sp. Bg11-31]